MSSIIINNKIIDASIQDILSTLRDETGNKFFRQLDERGDNVKCTCPYHKDGQESHPSCNVYSNIDGELEYGLLHCYTCGATEPLYKVVAHCFDETDDFGKEWLVERFGNVVNKRITMLPEITLDKNPKKVYNSNQELEKYRYFHPYMFQRKLTEEVIRRFDIGYNPDKNTITFPVWDEKGNLVMITQRSIDTKRFYIEADNEKPVYLLNDIIKNNITTVCVCESQINALTCWSYGFPAIALFGTGSSHQYDILNRSGIRNYILLFDGDEAGRKGAERFKKNINDDVFVKDILVPTGKDVNDLSKEEFLSLGIDKIDNM